MCGTAHIGRFCVGQLNVSRFKPHRGGSRTRRLRTTSSYLEARLSRPLRRSVSARTIEDLRFKQKPSNPDQRQNGVEWKPKDEYDERGFYAPVFGVSVCSFH